MDNHKEFAGTASIRTYTLICHTKLEITTLSIRDTWLLALAISMRMVGSLMVCLGQEPLSSSSTSIS